MSDLSFPEMGAVYFFDLRSNEDVVRVGYAGTRSRLDAHETMGQRLICVMPGSEDFEKRLHRVFRPDKAEDVPASRSCYRGDRIWGYCAWLLERGFASPSVQDLPHLPPVPWDAIAPDRAQEGLTALDGKQATLFAETRGQRIARAATSAFNSSLSDEWYSPAALVDSARAVMGAIDLDPASCPKANQTIRATHYYSQRIDGLHPAHPWSGRLWLNPPYGDLAHVFMDRLLREIAAGSVSSAVALLNNNGMSALWFQGLYEVASALVVTAGRFKFTPGDPGQKSGAPNTGHVLLYFGREQEGFCREFSQHGSPLIPWRKAP